MIGRIILGLAASAIAFGFIGAMHTEAAPAPSAVEAAHCRANLHCWGEANLAEANTACEDHVPRLNHYATRWTDGLLEKRFSRWVWSPDHDGTIMYLGDKIEFQNEFGAWVPTKYGCFYDPEKHAVVDAVAQPGRFSDD